MEIEKLNNVLRKIKSQGDLKEYENVIYNELDLRSIDNDKEEIIYLSSLLSELKFNLKEYDELELILTELIKYFPNEVIFQSQLALTLVKLNEIEKAILYFKKASVLDPDNFELNYNYALLLQKNNQTKQAVDIYEHLIEINKVSDDLFYNLGNAYKELTQYRKALQNYKKAKELNPKNDKALYNIGVVYSSLRDFPNAIFYYDEAIQLNENNIDAKWNKSLLLLAEGDFKNGWHYYEFRKEREDFVNRFKGKKIWNGENLSNKVIFVAWEQGFGDAIQFIRLLSILKEKGAIVYFECKQKLIDLFTEIKFIDKLFVKENKKNPKADYYVSLLSLPDILKLAKEDLPILKNYIQIEKNVITGKFNFIDKNKLSIGVCWQGSKDNVSDELRSVSYKRFIELAKIPNVQIVSMQFGIDTEVKNELLENNIYIYEENFQQTAELISHLDLVITVDTSIANLAGAIGNEVWVLLYDNCDWRWMRDTDKSPWYPSMKLIRQKIKGDWDDVFFDVATKIWMKNFQIKKEDVQFISGLLKFVKVLIDERKYVLVQNIYYCLKETKYLTPDLMNIFGICLYRAGELNEGLSLIQKAIDQSPKEISYLINKAIILFENNDTEKAFEELNKIVKIAPNSSNAFYNLGVAKQEFAFFDEAQKDFNKAIEIDSRNSAALLNRAVINLRKGNWKEGLKGFEERKIVYAGKYKKYDIKEWNKEDLTGKSIFIYSNEGYGDIIQFSRYLPELKKLAAKVGFECKKEIYPLIKKLNICDELFISPTGNDTVHSYDFYAELVSLPYLLDSDIKTIPKIPSKYHQVSKENEFNNEKINVGIIWEGNIDFQYSKAKSCNSYELINTLKIDGVELHNMQYEIKDSKIIDYFSLNSVNSFIEGTEDFYQTAKKIKSLDLLITVDTASAHLGGSLGIPTWVMLHKSADWRWGENNSTEWYESIRLFRQQEVGNWKNVFEEIKTELKKIVRTKYEKK